MADGGKGGDPLVLDKEWLKNFLDGEISEFQKGIKKISSDADGDYSDRLYDGLVSEISGGGRPIPSVRNLLACPPDVNPAATWPLTMGTMEEGIGSTLQGQVKSLAESLKSFLDDQRILFDDIEDNLREVMQELLKTEGASLEKIDGQKFMNLIEDVVYDTSGSGEGSGSENA
ncbi:type VII secretion system-associated protein [Streptomyces sp. NPDC057245]|uniref:type VII secretion system-associated protein n=1 Tax=Streptomyces TaxID=1883 RepID=UPI001C1DE53B|nr:type VII secretion system-associated protein [Streptomyces sp. A108]MBU6534598.1 type VII secretion system-associated protein [Streptomyces sp. A108]